MLRELDVLFRAQGHGYLYHVVITQRVEKGRSLGQTADELDRKEANLRAVMQRTGILGGCRVTHVKWSRHGGWHVHCHVIVESEAPWDSTEFKERFAAFDDTSEDAVHVSLASEPVEAGVVGAGQGELFEDRDGAGAALGYVLGELVQGVTAFPELDFPSEAVAEFAQWVMSKQMVRRFGKWRRSKEEKEAAEKAVAEERKGAAGEADAVELGLVDDVLEKAGIGVQGCVDAVMWLSERFGSRSALGQRLRREVRGTVF